MLVDDGHQKYKEKVHMLCQNLIHPNILQTFDHQFINSSDYLFILNNEDAQL